MKELAKNEDGSVATVVDLANEMIGYLAEQEVISEHMARHMSYKSMCDYTHDYFVKNIGVLCAMKDIPEEKWKSIESYLMDSKFDVLFGRTNKEE